MRQDDLHALPAGLPAPEDDGACDHLAGTALPVLALPATVGGSVDLSGLTGRAVVYVFPRAGNPSSPPLVENWNLIPGARGCTPQSCAFRDHHSELAALGAAVFGLSIQSPADQAEIAARLHLPFALLSDEGRDFAGALDLPTFEAAGLVLIKRLTLIVRDGVIETLFYPVFPPDRNAEEVIGWLKKQA